MSELKPCPFCGESDRERLVYDEHHREGYIECYNCGAKGPHINPTGIPDMDEQDAKEAWNRRCCRGQGLT